MASDQDDRKFQRPKGNDHAVQRAWERYGINLTNRDIGSIIYQVMDGRAEKVRQDSGRTAIYDVVVQGQVCRIVYNRARKFIVTFLPRDARGEPPAEMSLAEKSVTP